jgi:hypothetical protein
VESANKPHPTQRKTHQTETNLDTDPLPEYHHPRIFKAIVHAILTAAPGTLVCSIDKNSEVISDVSDIRTSQATVDHYLEAPTTNAKTHNYSARIYVSCIKPLFIIMKNGMLMEWLRKSRIYFKENDLSATLVTNVGILFFIHTKDSLLSHHYEQMRTMFVDTPAPEFKIKQGWVFSEKNKAKIMLIQMVQGKEGKEEEVNRKFQEVNDLNPYKYMA